MDLLVAMMCVAGDRLSEPIVAGAELASIPFLSSSGLDPQRRNPNLLGRQGTIRPGWPPVGPEERRESRVSYRRFPSWARNPARGAVGAQCDELRAGLGEEPSCQDDSSTLARDLQHRGRADGDGALARSVRHGRQRRLWMGSVWLDQSANPRFSTGVWNAARPSCRSLARTARMLLGPCSGCGLYQPQSCRQLTRSVGANR